MDAPSIAPPLVGTDANNKVELDIGVAAKLPNNETVLSDAKEDSEEQAIISSASTEDPEKIKLEKAVTKAQAAFRGYVVLT